MAIQRSGRIKQLIMAKDKKTPEIKFQDPEAERIFQALMAALGTFERKNKGQVFRSMMFGLADVYKSDRHKIMSVFQGTRAIREQKKTGARLAPKGKAKQVKQGCDGCGENSVSSADFAGKKVLRVGSKNGAQDKSIQHQDSEFASIPDILDRFESNSNAMIAFCQAKGIALPNGVKKADTIAKYMFNHYQKETDETAV